MYKVGSKRAREVRVKDDDDDEDVDDSKAVVSNTPTELV